MYLSPATTGRRMLHFVSRVDDSNAGDSVASPLTHYADRFAAFPFRRHDIRYIDWDAIHHDDVVILGGGGMFDHTEFMNRAINRLLRVGAPVIAWAPGFNTHFGLSPSFRTPIDFDRFALLTVRDFENGRHALQRSTAALIEAALRQAGVVLLCGSDGGFGVRLASAG